MPEGGLRFIIILTNYDDLVLGNLLAQYEVPAARSFREVQNVKICNFMNNTRGWGATNIKEAHHR